MNDKHILLLLISILFCFLLTSCGIPKPPEANQINQDFSEQYSTFSVENPFDETNPYVYDMNISASVDKRQTNEKSDNAYCRVQLVNEYYKITKYLKLTYFFYDKGGWILENCTEYQDPDYELLRCPFDAEEIAPLLTNDYSTVEFKEMNEHLSEGKIDFCFEVKDVQENVTSEGNVIVSLQYHGADWTYELDKSDVFLEWNIKGHWYSTIYSGLYMDVLDMTSDSVLLDVIYESGAEDARKGNRGPLFDTSDEFYWHATVNSTDLWEEYTDDGEPCLHFRFDFRAWGDKWNIYIYKDTAFAQVRMYKMTELYKVEENPFAM